MPKVRALEQVHIAGIIVGSYTGTYGVLVEMVELFFLLSLFAPECDKILNVLEVGQPLRSGWCGVAYYVVVCDTCLHGTW